MKAPQSQASNPVIQWFSRYLNDRRQVVRTHLTLSEPLPSNWGVLQGSILGPPLSSIYKSSPISTTECSVQSYVDETKLVITFKMKDTVNAFIDLRDDLHRIGQWCSNNLYCWTQPKLNLWCLVAGQSIPDWSLPASLSWEENSYRKTPLKTLGWSWTLT